MTNYLILAGTLIILLGLVHSVLGEVLIFRHVRRGRPLHAEAVELLPQRRWDALWSSWHLVTLLGMGLGGALVLTALAAGRNGTGYVPAIAATFAVASVYWLLGTRGKHPAWVVFAAISSILVYALVVSAK